MGCGSSILPRSSYLHRPEHAPMPTASLRRLDAVAARLPFAVDAYGAAGAAFVRWRASGQDEDKAVVDLWAYCYVQRYFYTRFLRERIETPSDVDDLISEALLKTLDHLPSIRAPERLASYVSVLCKRTFLSYRAGRQVLAEVEDVEDEPDVAPGESLDAGVIRWEIARAIERLPPAVGEVARMRFLEDIGYEEMGERTGQPLPTLRAYASKAMAHLRQNPDLQALRYDDLLPPGALGGGAVGPDPANSTGPPPSPS